MGSDEMKYLIILGLFFPYLVFADASPLPIATPLPVTLDVDQIIQMLSSALVIGKGLPGFFGAIFVGVVGIAIAALLIAKYFFDRGAREAAAYALNLQIQQTQAENLARMQQDATTAFLSNMAITYQQDYQYFIQMIKGNTFEGIYAKIAPQFHTQIAQFIYDQTISPEERAARVIMIVKPNT